MNNATRFFNVRWLPVLVLAALVLSACSAGTSTPAASQPPAAEDVSASETVQVTLSEYQISMPETLTAGTTTFEVTNAGSTTHGFKIVGQGIEEGLDSNLQPGKTATLQVDLAAGTYEIYCPIGTHRDQGMQLELTVSAP